MARERRRLRWGAWPFARLLELRLCDLGVRLEGTWVEECVARLHEELDERALVLRPHCWLSDEWFSPKSAPGIAIPFYLVHPRLMALERREMLEVEGGSRAECMKLLRHEAAHAVQVAYGVHRRRQWQRLFGKASKPYPDYYRPSPTSRRFVQHLDGWYAQSHPDEDFAETFAVWLDPRSRWRERYARWPALRKLEYVDALMGELAGERPKLRSRATPHRLSTLRQTLRSHYETKRERYAVDHPSAFDDDLCRLFSLPGKTRAGQTAMSFLRAHRREIRELVSHWTGEHQLSVDQVLNDIMISCRRLGLRAVGSRQRLKMECAVWVTVHTVHRLRRREWHVL